MYITKVSVHSLNTHYKIHSNNTSLKQLFALRTSKKCIFIQYIQKTLKQHFTQTTHCFTYIKKVCSFIKYIKKLKQHITQTALRFMYIKKVSVHSLNTKNTQTTLHSNNSSLYIHQKSVCSFINTKNTQTTLHSNNSSLYVHQKVSVYSLN
jgi:hypothetical protein